MIPEAIELADNYAKNASVISTYLRDQRNDALAFSKSLKTELGDKMAPYTLKDLVEQKPQNYEFRNLYADALSENKDYERAILTLKEAQRILAASGNSRADFNLRIAEFYQVLGQVDSTELYLKPMQIKTLKDLDKLRLARLLISKNKNLEAEEVLETISKKEEAYFMSDYLYTQGLLLKSKTNEKGAIKFLKQAIAVNPYHIKAIQKLIQWYEMNGSKTNAAELKTKLNQLKTKLIRL